METLLLVLAVSAFFGSFFYKAKPKGLSAEDKSTLQDFLDNPDGFLNDYSKTQDLLKVVQKCSDKEILEFYNKLRYKIGAWKDNFGEVKIAPIFEDIAFLYYQKQDKDAEKDKIKKQIREDFKFLCQSR